MWCRHLIIKPFSEVAAKGLEGKLPFRDRLWWLRDTAITSTMLFFYLPTGSPWCQYGSLKVSPHISLIFPLYISLLFPPYLSLSFTLSSTSISLHLFVSVKSVITQYCKTFLSEANRRSKSKRLSLQPSGSVTSTMVDVNGIKFSGYSMIDISYYFSHINTTYISKIELWTIQL